ncbi:DMT family transporter [Lacisediminimonas sp.]|uniref:DMT family transporter n=1 Tax=Lacisediminimonas sp. TaxID=3060582 RepID=UPI0027193A69|nr:DMT family transporter [Lacisediminimonas sp.]MDO8299235.1 DMT family transporter [Lacisediminimonas sp.]MDO9217066.1 DMT family transporter [Lacisediminimonas sp.]
MQSNRTLTTSSIALLTLAPLLWAGNTVTGRLVHDLVPPMTLNFFRWTIALMILLPFGGHVLRRSSVLWQHWRRYALIGLLGVGMYNGLQYLALQTSTPINVALVGAGMPVWILLVGVLFFKSRVTRLQIAGSVVSIAGVLLVLCRGDIDQLLALRLVPGDIFVIISTIAWAFYSWLLMQPKDPPEIRDHWAAFLVAQVSFGVAWTGLFAAGEWIFTAPRIVWGWPLIAAIAFVSTGPAIVAFRCWGAGVQRVGPAIGGFFSNLTPVFTALFSLIFLGEAPQWFHILAFVLVMVGIVLSSRR